MLPAWIIDELKKIEAEEVEERLLYLPIEVDVFDEEEELLKEILLT